MERPFHSALPPMRSLSATSVTAWLCYTIVLGFLYSLLPPNPDQAIFDYIGWLINEGALPYLDVAEQNFPGKMWLHAVSNVLFGNNYWSYRVFDFILLLPASYFMFRILRYTITPRWALVIVPLYQAIYVTLGSWYSGTRDIVAAHFLIMAGAAYCQRLRGGSRAWLVFFGTCAAAAALIRPTYCLFPLFATIPNTLSAIRSGQSRRLLQLLKDTAIGFLSFIVPLALVGIAGILTGQLKEWYNLTILYNLNVYSGSADYLELFRSFASFLWLWKWYFGSGAIGAILWWRSRRAPDEWRVCMSIGATSFLSALIQGKGFGYHFGGMHPITVLFMAFFIFSMGERIARSVHKRVVIASATVLGAVGALDLARQQAHVLKPQSLYLMGVISRNQYFDEHGYAAIMEISEYIKATVPKDETVLVNCRSVHINYLSQRRSPTRFITLWALEDLPQTFELGQDWTTEFIEGISRNPPAIIITETDPARSNTQDHASVADHIRFLLASHYALELRTGDLLMYRRIPAHSNDL